MINYSLPDIVKYFSFHFEPVMILFLDSKVSDMMNEAVMAA